MRLLIDTNILIPVEPTRLEDIEPGSEIAVRFLRVAHENSHHLLVHPTSSVDLARDVDEGRREARAVLIGKYGKLQPFPPISLVESRLGVVEKTANDWVDHHLLAAVLGDAVDLLITQDGKIHKKAARLGIADRVLTLEDALTEFETLHDIAPDTPPAVAFVPVHSMDAADPIFDSLRSEYTDFDEWLIKCKREGRDGWIVRVEDQAYAAVCIIKSKDDEYGLGGKVLKISTFKVSSDFQGNRFGELLLKALFQYCHQNSYEHAYVTVFPHHEGLITLLRLFGFTQREDARSTVGEQVYVKHFLAASTGEVELSALDFHIQYGPPALRLRPKRVFLVPIQPKYHRLLFPDAEVQGRLDQMPGPYGNALRKAYLCHSSTRRIDPGDVLLFYRSDDRRAVMAVGVAEEVRLCGGAEEIVSFVGQRTVYTLEEIRRLARKPVLTILFRQDRLLERPINFEELSEHAAILGAPRSITKVADRSLEWLTDRLGEPFSCP